MRSDSLPVVSLRLLGFLHLLVLYRPRTSLQQRTDAQLLAEASKGNTADSKVGSDNGAAG